MPRSNDIWILTADRRRARIFSADRPHSQELTEIQSFFQPDAAFQDRELVEPQPGRHHNSGAGVGTRHGMDSRSSEREKSTTNFVRDIVKEVEKAHHNGQFSKLVLVASPSVLGEIRNQLSNNVRQDVTFELDKELTELRPNELREYLPRALAPAQ
jgi:protein required for attachment to host cells